MNATPMTRARRALAPLGALLSAAACTDTLVPNYNNPILPTTIESPAALQTQVTGTLAGDRENHAFQILIMETMGRDAYRIDAADPRYINNPLGLFNPSAFVTNFLWNSHYRTIRSANDLVNGINASATFTAAEKAGARGVARTFKAHQYMRLIETRDTIGVPIALGAGAQDPIRCKPAVLDYISALLDSAATDLAAAGAAFDFVLPGGFSANGTFNTPAGFLQFNRGLKAKNEVYRAFRAYTAAGSPIDATALANAITALDASFFSVGAPFRNGVYHLYSTSSGDLTNGNFDQSVHRVNPKVIAEADAGDLRLSKVLKDPTKFLTTETVASDYLFTILSGPTTPLPLLLNEELILIRAEALWGQGNNAAALVLSNAVRMTSGGLPARLIGSFPTNLDILREILKQKRYSLLFESPSRAIDYRMFGLWAELGTERTPAVLGPRVVPLPESEVNARGGNLTCS